MKLPLEDQSSQQIPSPLILRSQSEPTENESISEITNEEPSFVIENRVEYITVQVDPYEIEPDPNEIDSIEFENESDDEQETQVYYELEGDLDALELLDSQALEQLGISNINLNVIRMNFL